MVNATFAYFLHPVAFGMQKIFALDLLLSFAFCDIDTESKFVQIHFFVQLNRLRKCQHGFQLRKVFFHVAAGKIV